MCQLRKKITLKHNTLTMMQSMLHHRPGPQAVIADDLTGAMDTGVHFLTHESPPSIRIANGLQLGLSNAPKNGVLVLDTETRLMEPRDAYNRVRSAVSELVNEGYLPFYKKIDSTYRGNVGTEVDAMLDTLGYPAAAVISAVPGAGRTVRNGICLVRGIPLHESESGTDRLSPQVTSSTQEIVASQSARKSTLIDHPLTSLQPPELAAELERRIKMGTEILLFDAATDDDIRRIVNALRLVPEPLLLVGAAGLAEALAGSGSPTSIGDPSLLGPGLFVSGSLMRTTAAQADRLASHTSRVGSVTLRPHAMVSAPANEANRLVENAAALAQSGRHILLRTTNGRPISRPRGLEPAPIDAGDIARFIGRVARRIVESSPVGTLILSGGSTAVAVIEALGITDLRIVGEAESGLPVCDAQIRGSARRYCIVTKAGGFGRIDSYERIMEIMDRATARRNTK